MEFNGDYYIGLDCGTESVGFAVTDTDYKVLKFRGKSIWGSHLFSEADTAEARRTCRSARRRYMRKKERIDLLQELFADEIGKVDSGFLKRLEESGYLADDKSDCQPNSLFNDRDYTDKEYYKDYPTIYHLRKALIEGTAPHDIRLLYLAIHHILKNRGHFLFGERDLSSVMDISSLLDDIKDTVYSISDEEILFGDINAVRDALMLKHKREKQSTLSELIVFSSKEFKTLLIKTVSGSPVKPEKLFQNENYADLGTIDFSNPQFEEAVMPSLEDALSDDEYRLVVLLKGLYDWSLLESVMEGCSYISYAKVALFERNSEDLRKLKNAVRLHAPEKYNQFFHKNQKGEPGIFSSYVGADHSDGKKTSARRVCTDVFYSEVRKLIGKNPEDDDSKYILSAIEDGSFLPLLISYRNSVIPYQVNKKELDTILEVNSAFFQFLTEKDSEGLSVIDKIDAIMTYRIPYYVGPLGHHPDMKNGWMVRKKEGRILPWNFNDMVDTDASAEKFIQRMISRCTYLPDETVLPKKSLLYSRFEVLNELNIVRINGQRLPVEQKQIIFNELFGQGRKVTQNKLRKFVISEGWYDRNDIEISGVDGDFKSDLSSYAAFRPYIDSGKLTESDAEEIISWLTTFSEGGSLAGKRIEERFGKRLSADEIRNNSRMKFSGWGRLSRKFLDGITAMNKETGELQTIIEAMWSTQHNLMELLDSSYGYVSQTGKRDEISSLDYSVVDELYVSPAVKRQIWQTLRIVDEIKHVMGKSPRNVFVEVTRGEGEKTRTKSRKQRLAECLEAFRKGSPEIEEIISELESFDDDAIARRDKLFLYFTQLGKSMYSGKALNLEEIGNTALYDVDHIYPYSKSDDDSLDNKVIVLKEENSLKSDRYPLRDDIREKMQPYWKKLLKMGLISDKKYQRLVRNTPLNEDDEKGFINRQLVETSQSTKATIEILKRYFGKDTLVVYSKAGKVSEFRNKYRFYKSRSVNSLHHAKDAYLNIVVGNVLHTKYTSDFFKRQNTEPDGYYSIADPFRFNVRGAWIKGDNGTISTVTRYMGRNDTLYTVQPESRTGQLFDLMPVSGGAKLLPRKLSDPVLQAKLRNSNDPKKVLDEWVERYGGYNKLSISHFALVSYQEKKNRVVRLIPVSIIDRDRLSTPDAIKEYCVSELELDDPEVIRTRVLMNTKLSINGFACNITGASSGGTAFVASSAVPLLLDNEQSLLVKRIDKFLEKRRIYKEIKIVPEFDGITEESLAALYDTLQKKAGLPVLSGRPSNQIKTIENGRDAFLGLTMEEQCSVIQNLMLYFAMGGGKADLSLIKGSSNAGVIQFYAKFNLMKTELIIYDQSVTGLFEKAERIKV